MKKAVTKRSAGKILALAMVLAMVFTTIAFAADTKTVEVKGYRTEGMTEEDIANADSHFSVSNVTDTFDATKFGMDAGLIVQSPAKVTLLDSDGMLFDVYKVTKKDETTFEYDEQSLPITEGQLTVYVADESGALDENGNPKDVEKTIDVSELGNYDVEFPGYLSGCAVTLTEPGDYYVLFRYPALAGAAQALITVKDAGDADVTAEDTQDADTTTENTDAVAEDTQDVDTTTENTDAVVEDAEDIVELTAQPTASKVLVNGTETSFDAYMIDGNNYFKLRDLAKAVNGTEKQFEVTWDGEKNAINLMSNKAYTEVGGEMAAGDGQEKTPVLSTSKILKDDQEVTLTAYTINENNYFKLRDIAKAFNIGITWDSETSTIGIDTSIDYVEQ